MKEKLILNINKIHTTEMGLKRIKNNLYLNIIDPVKFCKNMILNTKTTIYKKGRNYYCEASNIKITINSYSYTIITAHLI